MNKYFMKRLGKVTAVHMGLLLVLFIVTGWNYIFRKEKDIIAPVEFFVQVPSEPVKSEAETSEPEQAKPKNEIKERAPIRIKKKPKPKPKPKRRKKRTIPTIAGPKKPSPLSEAEIRKLLDLGATASDKTVIPDDENLQFEIIRRKFYNAWEQPASEQAGWSAAEATIWFNSNGSVAKAELTGKTGNRVMDESVIKALSSVSYVPGLKSDFIKRNGRITISFKIGDE